MSSPKINNSFMQEVYRDHVTGAANWKSSYNDGDLTIRVTQNDDGDCGYSIEYNEVQIQHEYNKYPSPQEAVDEAVKFLTTFRNVINSIVK